MGKRDLPDDDASVRAGSDETMASVDGGGGFVVGEPADLRDRLAMTRRLGLSLTWRR